MSAPKPSPPPSQPTPNDGAHPVVVVGAGAAGLTAALFAARAGAPVLLLQSGRKPGLKILASGGGRCNVLPSEASEADFFSHGSSKHARNVLRGWPLPAVTRWVQSDLGVPLKTEATGKVFPVSDRARDVLGALLDACRDAGVQLQTGARVHDLLPPSDPGGPWQVRIEGRPALPARRVVLATGGQSLPKSGSDGTGWRICERLGHTLTPRFPALVPLTFAGPDAAGFASLSGLSLPATLEVAARPGGKLIARETGDVLFTHRGLSGPATLQISRHLAAPEASPESHPLTARWLSPDGSAIDWRAALADGRGGRTVATPLRELLPRRLADWLLTRAGVAPEARLATLPKRQRKALTEQLERCPLPWHGTEGYKTAEVTAGGVPLAELQLKTLESRLAPGLHLCGELLDVTGRLGGYNFLWAWVSGRRAGEGAARSAG